MFIRCSLLSGGLVAPASRARITMLVAVAAVVLPWGLLMSHQARRWLPSLSARGEHLPQTATVETAVPAHMALCCLLQAASVQQAASGALVDRVLSPELLEEHLQPRAAREELIPLAVVLQGAVGPVPHMARAASVEVAPVAVVVAAAVLVAQEGLSHQSIAAVAVAASCLVEVLPETPERAAAVRIPQASPLCRLLVQAAALKAAFPAAGQTQRLIQGTARLLRAVPVTSETSFTVPWLEEAATAVHLSETECRITLPEMARQAAAVVAPAGCMTVQIWLEMVALVAAVAGHLRAAQTESLATEDSAAAVVAVAEVALTHQERLPAKAAMVP